MTVSANLTISDTQKPIISGVPQSYTQDCSVPVAPNTANPSVSDNCTQNLQLLFSEYKTYPNTCTTVINRKWSATDLCDNYAEAIQTITLVDTKAPVINNVPADLVLNGNATVPAIVYNVTATDDCDPSITPTVLQTEVINGCTKTIKRTWTAKDRCGNISTKIQTITINKPIACSATIHTWTATDQANNSTQVTHEYLRWSILRLL